MSRVLVLNKARFPINVVDVFDAVNKVFKGRALFVDTDTFMTYDFYGWMDNWDDAVKMSKLEAGRVVNSGRMSLVLPEVVVCKEYKGFGYRVNTRQRPSFSRRNIFIRDRGICQFCGKRFPSEELTMDHVVPKSKGGGATWKNIVLACVPCNNKKSDKTIAQAGMRLIREPFEPRAEDLKIGPMERLKMKIGKTVPKTWEQFLGKAYWLAELRD